MFRFFDRVVRQAQRVAQSRAEAHRNTAAYRDLQLLDERTLRDIGLSHRAAAEYAANLACRGPDDLAP